MALVRLMMIKFGAGLRFQKCSKPAFGFAVIFWCFVFSSMLSSFYYFRYNIIEKGSWGPKDQFVNFSAPLKQKKIVFSCTGIPLTTSATIHTQELSQLFTMNDEFFGKSYMFVNGIVSKIIPCILLPFLTVLLIVELQKAEQLRKISSMTKRIRFVGFFFNESFLIGFAKKNEFMSRVCFRDFKTRIAESQNLSKLYTIGNLINFQKKNQQTFFSSEKTTGLVIFMTVSFFVLELPIGISLIFQVSYTDFGYLYLATYINHVCNSIFIINATSHGVLCFFMSTQYRLTVAQILKIKVTEECFQVTEYYFRTTKSRQFTVYKCKSELITILVNFGSMINHMPLEIIL